MEIMNLLKSHKLLQLFEAYDNSKSEMCLITEYIGGGELFDRVIEDEFVLSEKVRKWSSNVLEGGVASTRHRIHDAVSGLLYLHQADPGGSQLHTQAANYPPRPQGRDNDQSRHKLE